MQAFSFGQINVPGQRNYVFVDEHNRHKRLKVMRACEGCRRRKIRCDGATTNAWPCSACSRLKLQCVPPAPFDQDLSGSEPDLRDASNHHFVNALDLDPSRDQGGRTDRGSEGQHGHPQAARPIQQHSIAPGQEIRQPYTAEAPERPYEGLHQHSNPSSVERVEGGLQILYPTDVPPPTERPATSTSEQGSPTVEGLSEAFGILQVDEIGVAPYLQRPSRHIAEPAAPVPEQEVEVLPLDTRYGSQIRIPPALMPPAEDAAYYFRIFFSEVHPYAPVVIRNHFFQQWKSDPLSISPLLLEAMLACGGRLSNDPARGAQWLALANKHEDSFLDTPRLSTIQALILLLKAREAAPKRGYYYRSWMTCKTIASMAKDLDLHEHHDVHAHGQSCGSSQAECLTKTRVWQTLMVCETMIGGPQGRYDYEVDLDTLDLNPDPPGSSLDPFEAQVSRQYAYFLRNVRNIRATADAYAALKKTKDWASHPRFLANNQAFDAWPDSLPPDLKLSLPADGSAPWMRCHFIGNMHKHYHLGRIMLERPQLMACKSFGGDSEWKKHITSCYTSAKILCRLQEAMLGQFGLHGLLCMQRGINFTIYAILTCIMLHLVAVTSPDPDVHTDARDYFTRHMRILEECMNAWPMEEMKAQIEALREAFSADKDQPFQLKASFPYGTPSEPYAASSPVESQYYQVQMSEEERFGQHGSHPYTGLQTMTPPMSGGSHFDSPHLQHNSGGMMPVSYNPSPTSYPQAYPEHSIPPMEEVNWNPTPIFHQWNTAFAIPQAALTSTPAAPPAAPSSAEYSMLQQQTGRPVSPPHPNRYLTQYPNSTSEPIASLPQPPPPKQQQQQQQPPPQPAQIPAASFPASFVSPKQWQQSVASVADPEGHKRRWRYSALEAQPAKRTR